MALIDDWPLSPAETAVGGLLALWALSGTGTGNGGAMNEAPDASFSITPESPSVGDTVTLDASTSTDPDGTITEYHWTITDPLLESVTATGPAVEFTADTEGVWTAELTVTDDAGAADTAKGFIPVGTVIISP